MRGKHLCTMTAPVHQCTADIRAKFACMWEIATCCPCHTHLESVLLLQNIDLYVAAAQISTARYPETEQFVNFRVSSAASGPQNPTQLVEHRFCICPAANLRLLLAKCRLSRLNSLLIEGCCLSLLAWMAPCHQEKSMHWWIAGKIFRLWAGFHHAQVKSCAIYHVLGQSCMIADPMLTQCRWSSTQLRPHSQHSAHR